MLRFDMSTAWSFTVASADIFNLSSILFFFADTEWLLLMWIGSCWKGRCRFASFLGLPQYAHDGRQVVCACRKSPDPHAQYSHPYRFDSEYVRCGMDCVEFLCMQVPFLWVREPNTAVVVQTSQNLSSSTHSRLSNKRHVDGGQLSLILCSQFVRQHSFGTAAEDVL